jgi:hypothetical protein
MQKSVEEQTADNDGNAEDNVTCSEVTSLKLPTPDTEMSRAVLFI